MPELTGRIALVTGGGQGLGEAICRTLGASGAVVIATDLRAERAEQTARRLCEKGVQASAFALDVGDENEAQEVVRRIVERHGRLDILINNAGTDTTLPLEELSFTDWDRILRTNLRGPFELSK